MGDCNYFYIYEADVRLVVFIQEDVREYVFFSYVYWNVHHLDI